MEPPRPGRADISRRLKAARWLAGGVNDDGKPAPLSVRELAARQLLVDNGISANRIEEFEQCVTDARPMELEKLADALGMSRGWFGPPVSPEEIRRLLARLAQELLQAGEEPPAPPGDMGPPQTAEGGGGG